MEKYHIHEAGETGDLNPELLNSQKLKTTIGKFTPNTTWHFIWYVQESWEQGLWKYSHFICRQAQTAWNLGMELWSSEYLCLARWGFQRESLLVSNGFWPLWATICVTECKLLLLATWQDSKLRDELLGQGIAAYSESQKTEGWLTSVTPWGHHNQ